MESGRLVGRSRPRSCASSCRSMAPLQVTEDARPLDLTFSTILGYRHVLGLSGLKGLKRWIYNGRGRAPEERRADY